MRIRTLHSSSSKRSSQPAAFLQLALLLLVVGASAACLSGVAGEASASVAGETHASVARETRLAETESRPGASDAARAARPRIESAALLPEPGAWMTTTLGLLGLEWMARRKRVA